MPKQPNQLQCNHAPSPPAEGHAHALTPLLQRPLHGVTNDVANGVTNGVIIGRVTAMTEAGVLVHIPGIGERIARALCNLPEDAIERECAVLFENGDLTRPLVMGLLLSEQHISIAKAAPELAHETAPQHELRIDGERLVIQADTELELRCGDSVILLQRDGRIEIRGNYITSQATATQRMRGGSIHMN